LIGTAPFMPLAIRFVRAALPGAAASAAAIDRERRMIGHRVVEIEPAEPSVGQMRIPTGHLLRRINPIVTRAL
jgi:hypothetical protein